MSFERSSHVRLLFLCFCCLCWAFGFGLECPLAARWLQDAGCSPTLIGANTAVHFLAVILVGAIAPTLIRRLGRNCILFGLLVSGLAVAAFPLAHEAVGWFSLRLLAGAGGAMAMIALETLINWNSPAERRARDFAFYACSVGLGFALGSFTGLHLHEQSPWLAFAVGGGITLLAVPVVWLLPDVPQSQGNTKPTPLQVPFLSVASAWCQGFLEAGMLALLPLYLRIRGFGDGESGTLLGAILLGVLLFQVPIGWLADRVGRQRTLLGCYLLVALGLAFIPTADGDVGLPFWLFLIGICSGAFYPLGLALLGERVQAEDMPRANALFLGFNCFGSLVSPLLSGPIMESWGPSAMFWTAEAVIMLVLLYWALLVICSRRRLLQLRTLQTKSGSFR